MSNPTEKPKEKTGTELIRESIKNAPMAVEKEFSRTANSWLECFGSRLFQIETYLNLRSTKKELTEDKFRSCENKLDKLKDRFFELKKEFGDTVPSDEIKNELFGGLNILD